MSDRKKLLLTIVSIAVLTFCGTEWVEATAAQTEPNNAPTSTRKICPADATPIDCDAKLLAMEISNELRPPPLLYAQIHADLTAIHQAYPSMSSIHHSPPWVPGQLILGLTSEATEKLLNGEHQELNQLHAQYEVETIHHLFANFVVIHFAEHYNPEYLVPTYLNLSDVTSAEPNYLIGTSTHIRVDTPRYTFVQGSGDCAAGCIDHQYWTFDVADGIAILIGEDGRDEWEIDEEEVDKRADPSSDSHRLYFPIIIR